MKKTMTVFMAVISGLLFQAPMKAGFGFEDTPYWVVSLKNAAPVVLPGFMAGFLVQSKFQNPSLYFHAAALPLSMYVTNYTSQKYFKSCNSRPAKHSTDAACAGAFFMYGLGLVTGTAWKAYWFKKA